MRRKSKSMSMQRRESLWGFLFISPWIIGFLLFTVGPMIASLVFSFADYNIISPPTNFGFSNYIKLFTDDPDFWRSLGITAKFAIIAIPLNLVFGFACQAWLSGVQCFTFLLSWRVWQSPFCGV
jgi:multiple sugar transport system permease protein